MNNDFLLGEIYYIFLPLLLFDSAFNNQFYVVQQQIPSAILLAGPGVLISIGIVALVAVYIFPYNWS
jgi:NhaP-type Na+/H+ or K+/H+ antiporter